jgi:hypothetical protein
MIDAEKPVDHPREFFGQKNIVRRIFSRIGAPRPQSVAVIAGRKVGKTSLLRYLAHDEIIAAYLPDPSKYLFIHLEIKDDPAMDAPRFLEILGTLLSVDGLNSETAYNKIQRRVEGLHGAGKKIVLFFDDFHNITRNTNFPLEFFSFLRSLANNFNLAYVTSSYLELQKLCVAKDIEESPFFNIFTNVALGILANEDACSLLAGLSGWDAAAVKDVVAWAGPLPYIIKLIARECGASPPPNNHFEKLFLPVLKNYFELILSVLSREAYKPLKELAKGKDPDPRDSHYLKPLIRHHFLLDDDGSISFFSEAFKIFVRNHAAPELLKGNDNYL